MKEFKIEEKRTRESLLRYPKLKQKEHSTQINNPWPSPHKSNKWRRR